MAKAKKAPKADDPESVILDYLRKTNRPYSATDITNNLHGAIAKTAVQKTLAALHEKNQIAGKAYGKQWVYVAKQDELEVPSQEELSKMDETIEQLKRNISELKDANKDLSSKLNGLTTQLTNEKIQERLKELATENASYEERLTTLRSGTRIITQDERKRVDELFENNRKLWAKRKRMFNEIFGAITEHMPGKPSELMDELGVETDADAGVDFAADPLAGA